MRATIFNIEKPFRHWVSGKFTAHAGWKHKKLQLHDNYEMLVGLKGDVYLSVNGTHQILCAGKFILLPANASIEGYQSSNDKVEFYWFHFFPHSNNQKIIDTKDLLDKPNDNQQLISISESVVLPAEWNMNEFSKIIVLANEVLDIARENYYTNKAIDYFITQLTIQISNDFLKSFYNYFNDDSKIQTIKDWIRANLTFDLSVSQTAQQFNLNPRYLSTIFKRKTGKTILNYIIELKLNIAKNLLVKSDLPIKIITDRSYFKDEKYFFRMFRKNVGITPTEYRRSFTQKYLTSDRWDPEIPNPSDLD